MLWPRHAGLFSALSLDKKIYTSQCPRRACDFSIFDNHARYFFHSVKMHRLRSSLIFVSLWMWLAASALAHGVAVGDKGYIQEITGVNLLPFMYLGAKHMVTGYDHLLFLFGIIFFLYKLSHVALYVSLFAVGHSVTLLLGVYVGTNVSPYLIDAIIGLSIVYKSLDNLGAFGRWFGFQPNVKLATLVFGFFHGFGLASKIQEFQMSQDGLVFNLLAFNVGVEMGQLLALWGILIAVGYWRRTQSFMQHAYTANVVVMCAGFLLMGYQLTGYLVS
jgi:HupE / UreJ protein